MDSETLNVIEDSLANIAAAFAERRRQAHPSHGGAIAFSFLHECFERELRRLRGTGQKQLADALQALRGELEGANK